jgi:hypothetical protein
MPKVMRGGIPSRRHELAAAQPHKVTVEPPPQFLYKPVTMSMWGNDVYGDCVTAEEAFAKACTGVVIGDHKAVVWARQHYALNGASLWEIMHLMQTEGFHAAGEIYTDGPFKSVDWSNDAILRSAISEGPVKIGITAAELEDTYQAHPSSGWIATGYKGIGQQDHCTGLCGYGPFSWTTSQLGVDLPSRIDGQARSYVMFTWSTLGIIDEPSLQAICGEAWLRSPTTIMTADV